MQILEIPFTYEDTQVAVSLKGVTILKTSRYKKRHTGAPDFIQHPHIGFLSKSESRRQFPAKAQKPHRRITQQKPVQVRKPAAYTIDAKQVTHRILGFTNSMQGYKRLHLWTISFPVGTPDAACFHLLRKWLQRMTTDERLQHYCRVAERQENGTVHFHLAVNQYIDVQRANRYMRAAMMRSVDEGTITMSRDAIKKYNGVDIAKDRKTRRTINFAKRKAQKSLSNYLAKYVSKNKEAFPQLAWHNSRSYSNVIIQVNLTLPEYIRTGLNDRLELGKPLDGEWFTFYRWRGPPPDTVQQYLAFVTNHINTLN